MPTKHMPAAKVVAFLDSVAMSYEAPLTSSERLVLVALVLSVDSDGILDTREDGPSAVRLLALRTSLGRTTVTRCMARLAELRLVGVTRRRRPSGGRATSVYHLLTRPS